MPSPPSNSAPPPSATVVRSRGWQLGFAAVLAGIAFAFAGALSDLFRLWTHKADYSHGLLAVPFAGYLLWVRRDLFPAKIAWPDLAGLPLLAAGAGLFVAAGWLNLAKEWFQAFAVVLALAGAVVMFCGRWGGLEWAWPALLFPVLAFELPYRVEATLSLKLRELATAAGNAVFQVIGLPSYSEGNVIVIGDTRLGVEQACSGLSMLLTFVAVTAAVALLARSRPVADRVAVFLSAVPIAVVCNVGRIVGTGLVYHAGWTEFGNLIVHDLFGWLMMPVALGIIWAEFKLIYWLIVPVETADAGQILQANLRVSGNRTAPIPVPVKRSPAAVPAGVRR